jgi:hypothetical protein
VRIVAIVIVAKLQIKQNLVKIGQLFVAASTAVFDIPKYHDQYYLKQD